MKNLISILVITFSFCFAQATPSKTYLVVQAVQTCMIDAYMSKNPGDIRKTPLYNMVPNPMSFRDTVENCINPNLVKSNLNEIHFSMSEYNSFLYYSYPGYESFLVEVYEKTDFITQGSN